LKTLQRVSFRAARANLHRLSVLTVCLLLCVFSSGCMKTIEPPVAPPAPEASARIAAAKTVFVSNLGSNQVAADLIMGGANEGYKAFYASLEQWGHFNLVDSPAKADLIFEIYTTARPPVTEWVGPGRGPNSYQTSLSPAVITLTVKDTPTLNVLWSTQYNLPLYGNTQKGRQQHFIQEMQGLTNEVEGLVPSSDAVSTPAK
jgi:hypothetical protein